MTDLNRLPFSPQYEYVSGRRQAIGDHSYEPGEQIHKDGLSVEQLMTLYRWRFILPIVPGFEHLLPVPPARAPEVAPAGVTAETEPTATGATIRHAGFGKWYVDAPDGTAIAGPMSRAEADAFIAEREAVPA